MALNNPAFNNPAFQDKRSGQAYPTLTPPPAASAAGQHAGVNMAAQAQMEGMYAAPAAGAVQTDRMTVEDTVMKTVSLFAVLLVTAAVGWVWTYGGLVFTGSVTMMPWIVGMLGGFVLAMVNIFKKIPSVPLIVGYAAFEGLFVGGISAYFEVMWPGIVLQATAVEGGPR